ncbi:MAG: hypothetical protein ACFCVE_06575 [Phycisphaerae bacterium]
MRHTRTEASEAAGTPPNLITAGVLAARLGVPLHRVLHVLATRRHITPSARAGTLRLYSSRAVDDVRRELADIDRRRTASRDASREGVADA